MTRFRKLALPFLLLVLLLLGACEGGNTNVEEVDLYPVSIQNGDISVEYYDAVQEYHKKNSTFIETVRAFHDDIEELTFSELYDSGEIEKYRAALKEYNTFIREYKIQPISEKEKEHYKVLQQTQEKYIEYGLEFTKYLLSGNERFYEETLKIGSEIVPFLEELREIENS